MGQSFLTAPLHPILRILRFGYLTCLVYYVTLAVPTPLSVRRAFAVSSYDSHVSPVSNGSLRAVREECERREKDWSWKGGGEALSEKMRDRGREGRDLCV